MDFDGDAFISYAHLDNVELEEGHKGWVSNLHRALEVRITQFLGKPARIWRDPKLQGNDAFADTLIQQLQHVAALVPVVSPRYVKSEWTRRELSEFWKAAGKQGGVRFHDKVRVFKVLKTHIAFDKYPPELQAFLGYEFFKIEPETGRVREFDEVFGPEAKRDFWLKLDDLAHDICQLLETIEHPEKAYASPDQRPRKAIFLAETTSDLREQREALRRDLQQHGYTVVPARALSPIASELRPAVQVDLFQSQLSIHMVGKNHSVIPEGGVESLLEIQNELAIERGKEGGFFRLLWIPPNLQPEDERQRKLVEQIRTDPRILEGADLLENDFEDFRTVVHSCLKQRANQMVRPTAGSTAPGETLRRLYLIYDQKDADVASPWVDFLFEQNLEVVRPVFEGDEAEIREEHEENLRSSDGALILYGSANECWLRRKLRELQKSRGYGRIKPPPVVGISLIPPKTAEKESFRTHEAIVIPQFEGFSSDPLGQFISRLHG
jgi:hypothetical protein